MPTCFPLTSWRHRMWTVCRAANIKTLLMFQQVDVPQHYLGKFAKSATLWQFAEPYNTKCTQIHKKCWYHVLFSCFNVSSAVCCNVLYRDGVKAAVCYSYNLLECATVCCCVPRPLLAFWWVICSPQTQWVRKNDTPHAYRQQGLLVYQKRLWDIPRKCPRDERTLPHTLSARRQYKKKMVSHNLRAF